MRTYDEMRKAVEGKSLEWLEDKKFMNDMIDRWRSPEYMWDTVLCEAIHKIKEGMKNGNA